MEESGTNRLRGALTGQDVWGRGRNNHDQEGEPSYAGLIKIADAEEGHYIGEKRGAKKPEVPLLA